MTNTFFDNINTKRDNSKGKNFTSPLYGRENF